MRRAALICVLLLSACSHERAATTANIRNDWNNSLSPFGAIPIYPMRENFYPGDILLYVPDVCTRPQDAYSPVSQVVWLGSIPPEQIALLFTDIYGGRPELPETTTQAKANTGSDGSINKTSGPNPSKPKAQQGVPVTAGADKKTPPQKSSTTDSTQTSTATDIGQAIAQPTGEIFPKTKSAPKRMRLAAYPSLSVTTHIGDAISGSGSEGLFSIFGGAASEKSTSMTVSFARIEVADLPASSFYIAVNDFLSGPDAKKLIDPKIVNYYTEFLQRRMYSPDDCKTPPQNAEPVIFIINRVYYARQINFQLGNSSGFAARLGATLVGTGAGAKGTNTPSPSTKPTGSVQQQTDQGGGQISADDLAKTLSAAIGIGGEGGGATLALGSTGDLELKVTFDRPLAFMADQPIGYPLHQAYAIIGNAKVDGEGKDQKYICPHPGTETFCKEANDWLHLLIATGSSDYDYDYAHWKRVVVPELVPVDTSGPLAIPNTPPADNKNDKAH